MSKHTPGPWSYGPLPNSVWNLVVWGSGEKSSPIGLIGLRCAEDDSEFEANARLIAAAPDLLRACCMQQRLIADMARFVGVMTLPDYNFFDEVPVAAASAIARATGGGA